MAKTEKKMYYTNATTQNQNQTTITLNQHTLCIEKAAYWKQRRMKDKSRMEHFHSSSLECDKINVMTVAAWVRDCVLRKYFGLVEFEWEGERERERMNDRKFRWWKFAISTAIFMQYTHNHTVRTCTLFYENCSTTLEIKGDFLIKVNKTKWSRTRGWALNTNQIIDLCGEQNEIKNSRVNTPSKMVAHAKEMCLSIIIGTNTKQHLSRAKDLRL